MRNILGSNAHVASGIGEKDVSRMKNECLASEEFFVFQGQVRTKLMGVMTRGFSERAMLRDRLTYSWQKHQDGQQALNVHIKG
jgi:hypothetical protein